MDDFELIDETLDIDSSANYELSIQLQLDGLSFSVLDTIRKKYILLKHLNLKKKKDPTKALKKLREKSELLSAEFRKVHLLYSPGPQALVPEELFREETAEDLFRFNLGLREDQRVRITHSPEFKLFSLFALPEEVLSRLEKIYPGAGLYHTSTCLLKNLSQYSAGSFPVLLLHAEEEQLWIAAKADSRLSFFNCFSYRSDMDMIYFLELVSKQLGYNNRKHHLLLSGNLGEEDEVLPRIRKYHELTNKIKPWPGYSLSYLFQDLPEHTFSNLLNAAACGS
jgi:hypothetical protein